MDRRIQGALGQAVRRIGGYRSGSKTEERKPMKHETKVERKSERELVASRIINGPPPIVFEAWTKPELFKKWWVPKSAPITLLACDMDIRTGGKYRLRF